MVTPSEVTETGTLSLNIGVDLDISQGQASSRTTEVNTDDFKIKIYTEDGILVKLFDRYADIPDAICHGPSGFRIF